MDSLELLLLRFLAEQADPITEPRLLVAFKDKLPGEVAQSLYRLTKAGLLHRDWNPHASVRMLQITPVGRIALQRRYDLKK